MQIAKGSTVGEGRVFLRAPEGRTTMVTTIQNPVADPLELELTINGVVQKVSVPGNQIIKASRRSRLVISRSDSKGIAAW